MPLGTLDRTPPPFFRQGPSALSKLTICSALAVFLMVADVRFGVTHPLRAVVASALYPFQWLVFKPVQWVAAGAQYFQQLRAAQQASDAAQRKMAQQAQRASQVEPLLLENERLRRLLELRPRLGTTAQPAQVLYDAADPYSRKIVIDKGLVGGVALGSPVIDESGVLGQVTRVYATVSEVSLLSDRDQAIPVLNTRTGSRGVAFGDGTLAGGGLELRYTSANADVLSGDLLSTSGVDGVYPPGLPVARIDKVERRVDSAFARITLIPVGLVSGALHVLVLKPLSAEIAARPAVEPSVVVPRKPLRK